MPEDIVLISRPSRWGNPYVRGFVCQRCDELHAKRGSTLKCFEEYLIDKLKNDPDLLLPLKGKTLLCRGCPPGSLTCHGRVYEKLLGQ